VTQYLIISLQFNAIKSQCLSISRLSSQTCYRTHESGLRPDSLADSVNRFFKGVAGVAADLSPLDDSNIPPPPDVLDEFTISMDISVERKLSRVKVHKAPGPDGLPNWLLYTRLLKSSRRSSVRHLQRVKSRRILAVVVEGGERRAGAESTAAQSR